ncbi:MAG: glycosyl hydrolase 108 family protein [Bacteroidota bacterium]
MMTFLFIVGALVIGWLAYFLISINKPYPDEKQQEVALDTLTVTAPPPVVNTSPAASPENTSDMAQFQIAYDIVRRHEGGYQKMPEDSGNYNSLGQNVGTNWGINAQVYENYLKRPPSEQDMRTMPRHIALRIYKALYWDRIKGDEIRDQQVANILFDGHVNHGRWGIQMMQGVLGLSRDGIVGPLTLAAINKANPFQLFNAYKKVRIAGYKDLVRRRPKDQRFLNGWLKRINSFIYQGGGLLLPGSGSGRSNGSTPTNGGGGSGGTVVAIGLAIVSFLLLR